MANNKLKKYFEIFVMIFVSALLIFFAIINFYKTTTPVDWQFINSLIPRGRDLYLPFTQVKDRRNYFFGIITFLILTIFYLTVYWRQINDKNKHSLDKKFFLFFCFAISIIYIKFLFIDKYGFTPSFSDISPYLSSIYYYLIGCVIFYLIIKFKIIDYLLYKLSFISNLRIYTALEYFLIFISIFLLLFTPHYQYMFEGISYYGGEMYHYFLHANFFIAPINEVLNGKFLLINVNSQYGLLLTYFAAWFFKIFGFSYANFSLYTILMCIIYSFIFYLVIKKVSKSGLLALFGTLAYMKIVYFRSFLVFESYIVPSTTAVRYFFDVIALFTVYYLFKNFTLKKLYVANFIIAIAFFYNFEIGLSIIVAYGACLFIKMVIDYLENGSWMRPLWYLGNFFLNLIFVLLIISLITYFKSGIFPNWILYLISASMYGKGAYDFPMAIINSYYFPLLIYITTFFLLVYKIMNKKINDLYVLTFLLIYGVTSFYYYVVFSETHHLITVVHPAIILGMILTKKIIQNWKNIELAEWKKTFLLLFIFIVFNSLFQSNSNDYSYIRDRLSQRINPITHSFYYWDYPGTYLFLANNSQTDFAKAADTIKLLTPNIKDIVIISRYDTLLYVMTRKTSLVNHPILENDISFIKAKNQIIDSIKLKKPKYIFVYSDNYSTMIDDTLSSIWNGVKNDYEFVESAGVINVFRLKRVV